MEQQTSAAHAFFQAHKDLFQYEKYVVNHDPVVTESNPAQAHDRTTKSFLEQYRELDRERVSVPALSEQRFSLPHPPAGAYSLTNLAVNTIPAVHLPEFVTLKSTASILENFNNLQHEPIRSHVFAASLQHTSQHTQPQAALRVTYDSSPAPQYPSPKRVSDSNATVDQSLLLQQQRSPIRQPVESNQKIFSVPKLAELLIDRETRAAGTAHKSWDAAHKIEILIGSKCVGRVSAASRNIPPSIRSRLLASANVSVRRERLYELLHRDYEELSKRYTQ
ncbi:hypothetical protein PHYPSEUDO_004383 [Phytophthora pseudosyringae]|uniref:Uncharacterized protein n=1 Tax=Phytophthora pseudosyringae TaxID=221518 RepID=A0A8T1VN79_9STRA|nr:hypothetical protein PHYPSEUDO_004383 [Phytophthora pseudosyringae]